MQSCSGNDVKIYNLSAEKALPDWISAKKKRKLLKSAESRRQIELIQDFEMPNCSTNIEMSSDGDYIMATGVYKPRVRCYDVRNMGMKFERCLDSEVVRFQILSPDYTKLVFLQSDRYIELHAQDARYFRLRIPKFGRDLAYHSPSCDLYVAGATSEVYRLNLELGRFMQPLVTDAVGINRCITNPVHHLMVFGTEEGRVEAWDPRAHKRAGTLDVALSAITGNNTFNRVPSVTALRFKDGLTLGVGTGTGQILLYDIRSQKPLLVKDHYYSLPILNLEFHPSEKMVFSMDSKIVKIWEESNGNPVTAVEEEVDFNDFCLVPNTGMFFVANDDQKILPYYVPSLGPAPRWCSFLDNLTEELEESEIQTVFDDYKFVTEKELHDIGLGHLIGTNLLRPYMHGYFMDMRLYRKAKSALQPFEFDEFKKRKIREKLQDQRTSRLKLSTLPKVNKELALKLMNQPVNTKKKTGNLMDDDRFKVMFENPDFEVDKSADEFRLLNPVVSSIEKRKMKKLESVFTNVEEEEIEAGGSSGDDSSSSDEDRSWVKEVREQRKQIRNERHERKDEDQISQPKFYEIKPGEDFKFSDLNAKNKTKQAKVSLEERLALESNSGIRARGALGSREMTFKLKSRTRNVREDIKKHQEERKNVRRSAGVLRSKKQAWKR